MQYTEIDEDLDWYFVSEDGNDSIALYRLDFNYVTDLEEWEVGETYEIEVTYEDVTTQFSIEVIPNSIESIEYEPASPFKLTKGVDGYWDDDVLDSRCSRIPGR